MQTVSSEWKEHQKQTLLSESFVEVSLAIADPDALADATSQDNGATYISNTAQIVSEVDRNITPYSTLEQNMWVLDGTRKILPVEDYGDNGFIGNKLSDARGSFDETPILTINFTRVHHNLIPAVTIVWSKAYNEFAEDFTVTCYNGDEVVARKEVLGNKSVESVVMMDIVDYDRITIEIFTWCLPSHRARVEEVFVGMNKVYSKRDLFSYTHTQTVDPISTSLPKMEIKFSIDNSDNAYNPYNDEGLSKYLMERQEVKARYGYKINNQIEWIKGGSYYLSEWVAPQNGMVADFTARDMLEFMFAEYTDAVNEITERSLYDLAETILTSVDLPLNNDGTRKWHIDESLREKFTSAPLPQDTIANCLLMIANAGGCAMWQSRDGILRIEPISNNVEDYTIGKSNSYSRPETELTKPVKEVAVKVYRYSLNENGEIEDEATEMVFPLGDKGERLDVDNPLITDANTALSVGRWVAEYLINRLTLDTNWRPDVRLDALDIIKVENDYNTANARITDVTYTFGGAFKGKAEGRVI